jgi:hypothetical protein
MGGKEARARLVAQLQLAYSGELGAGFAYRGHWRSLRDPDERARVRQIEEEEWHHRDLVGDMLKGLGAGPRPFREAVFWIIGRCWCGLLGLVPPMYGAGRLSDATSRSTRTRPLRRACGRVDYRLPADHGRVEWDHELYFRAKATAIRWPDSFASGTLPPREAIRAAFTIEPESAGPMDLASSLAFRSSRSR